MMAGRLFVIGTGPGNPDQMTPEARGTALGLFLAALYLGQTAGVAAAAVVFDRYQGAPVFLTAAAMLLALGLWFAHRLRQRALAA